MPLLQTRQGDDDGGYAVSDYRTVRAELGTTDELRTLTRALRAAGISLVLDLVLNHASTRGLSPRNGDAEHRAYFHVFGERTIPDAYERTLPEVFPDFAPGNFRWDTDLGAWVWTTFNHFQWDVNWPTRRSSSSPPTRALPCERRVEVLRVDAIAFLWKRMGTSCQNQPEVHAITQALRALIRIACPAVLLKAEANRRS